MGWGRVNAASLTLPVRGPRSAEGLPLGVEWPDDPHWTQLTTHPQLVKGNAMEPSPASGGEMPDALPSTLGRPALRALALAGIAGYRDLAGWSADGLLALHGVAPKAVNILAAGLEARNSGFAPGPRAAGP